MLPQAKTRDCIKQSIIDEIPKQSRHLNLSQQKIITEPIVNKKLILAKSQISHYSEKKIYFNKQRMSQRKQEEYIK